MAHFLKKYNKHKKVSCPAMFNTRVVNYNRSLFIRLAPGRSPQDHFMREVNNAHGWNEQENEFIKWLVTNVNGAISTYSFTFSFTNPAFTNLGHPM